MTTTPVARVSRGNVVRFTPEGRTNRVHVMVDAVTFTGSMTFVHGVRCTPEGVMDSQARPNAWPVRADARVEVTAQ